MHATTKPEDKELLTKLRKLISTNEKIKKAEAEFRVSCKVEDRGITKFRLELLDGCMTSGLMYQKKRCKSKRFPVRRSWRCWRRRTRPRGRSWRRLPPWMGGLQRGRAGGCSVMRRPQVAAEFKESTFNFNFNLTFAEDSLLIQSST